MGITWVLVDVCPSLLVGFQSNHCSGTPEHLLHIYTGRLRVHIQVERSALVDAVLSESPRGRTCKTQNKPILRKIFCTHASRLHTELLENGLASISTCRAMLVAQAPLYADSICYNVSGSTSYCNAALLQVNSAEAAIAAFVISLTCAAVAQL